MTNKMWIILSVLLYFASFNIIVCKSPSVCQSCMKSSKCQPPDCFCCRDELKLPNLSLSQIPQIVFFTFDDAVTEQVSGFYNTLFSAKRKNPNGCPVSMTLFISHDNTKYRLVAEFHRKGMEIASHSVTHSQMNGSNFFQEAKKQKENLAKLAGIPIEEITGWRSPFLKPTGDLQPDALKKLGYTYDATLTFSKRSFREKPPGPFTLDFGYPYECQVKPCPKHKHPGFWEVPVVSLLDYKQAYDCVYVDGCMNAPPDEDSAYQFLWDNFYNYYTTTKMPFGINMHPSWFYYPDRLKAMDRFIQKLVSLNDVYIISANRMLEWLKRPTPLQDLHSFTPWACDGSEKAFQTGPRLVKTNLPPPLPPRSFISWTKSPAVSVYTPAPPARQQTLTKTRLFTPVFHNNESTRFIQSQPRKHLFTLDLSNNRRRQRTRANNDDWIRKAISPKVTSRNVGLRTRTRRPESPPPITPRLSQQERLDQHEEHMRRQRILQEQKRQQEILEQRQKQIRHQELLEQQRQQELAEKQRQDILRQQNENRRKETLRQQNENRRKETLRQQNENRHKEVLRQQNENRRKETLRQQNENRRKQTLRQQNENRRQEALRQRNQNRRQETLRQQNGNRRQDVLRQQNGNRRQETLRQQSESRGQQRILWKPTAFSSDIAQEITRSGNNGQSWKPKIHQETIKVWPHIGQSFIVPQNRIRDRQRVSPAKQIETLSTRNVVPNLQGTTNARFADVTPAPVQAPRRNVNRFTESPRQVWYADMRSRFGPITNGPRFSRGGSNRRPGHVDTTPGPRNSLSPSLRQRRIQPQELTNNSETRQRERDERLRQQQLRDRRGRGITNRINNDLNTDVPSFPVRDRTVNKIPPPSRNVYSRNILHPTIAQQRAWNSFIRQMLGPH